MKGLHFFPLKITIFSSLLHENKQTKILRCVVNTKLRATGPILQNVLGLALCGTAISKSSQAVKFSLDSVSDPRWPILFHIHLGLFCCVVLDQSDVWFESNEEQWLGGSYKIQQTKGACQMTVLPYISILMYVMHFFFSVLFILSKL